MGKGRGSQYFGTEQITNMGTWLELTYHLRNCAADGWSWVGWDRGEVGTLGSSAELFPGRAHFLLYFQRSGVSDLVSCRVTRTRCLSIERMVLGDCLPRYRGNSHTGFILNILHLNLNFGFCV